MTYAVTCIHKVHCKVIELNGEMCRYEANAKRLLQVMKAGLSPGNNDKASILLYTIEKG